MYRSETRATGAVVAQISQMKLVVDLKLGCGILQTAELRNIGALQDPGVRHLWFQDNKPAVVQCQCY